jgi:vitamin B12 transporter
MKHLSFPAALLLGSSVFAAQAQTNPDTLLVTATRTAQTADQALASVTVITREEIERKQAQTVTELLEQTPGVVVSNSGGRGKATSVFLRGTKSNQLLVLIDGIKVGSATDGAVAFQQLSPAQIERIEIVRGPRSSLYGSEAIGGVIQIFTRKGKDGFKPRFSVGAGSDGSREVTLGVSGGNEQGWFNLGASDYSTDGFDATTVDNPSNEPDKDGYDNRSYKLGGGYRFSDQIAAELNYSQSRGENDYDGYFFGPMSDSTDKHRVQTLGGKLTLDPLDNWQLTLSAGRSWDAFSGYDHGVFLYDYETVRDTAGLQSSHILNTNNQFTWGIDYLKDSLRSSNPYNVDTRDNLGLFGLYQLALGKHDVSVSLRHDDNEQFGGYTTGSAAWGVELPRNFRLTAGFGSAFRAPGFNVLYLPFTDYGWGTTYEGNPNLKPEESKTFELGLSGDHAGVKWSATAYKTDIENLIVDKDLDPSPSVWKGKPLNIDEARIRGLELTAATHIANWDLSTTLDLLDPKDRSDNSLLPRRSRKMFNISADRDFGQYALGASLRAVGKAKDTGGQAINGYTTVDLRGSYQLTQDWALKAKIENLLDEDYQTVYGYNQPDRTWWLSLHYAP